jgi:hypothetical protein
MSITKVASVHIKTGLIWSDILIESSGGSDPLSSHGHRKADARRGFDVSYLQAFDVEMWLRLLESGDLLLLPEALCSIRLHPEQATKANLRSGQVVEDKRRLFREFATQSREGGSLLDRAMWDLRMASSVARSGPQTARLLKESGIREVYFPDFFRHGLLPAASLVQKLASCRLRR